MHENQKIDRERCSWCGNDPLYVAYHDEEWGVPEHESKALFEKLLLDGFQAGLAWITVLRKRDHLRAAFDDFDPEILARYSSKDLESRLKNPNIIRNRAKVMATATNAQAYLRIEESGTSFADFLWAFVGAQPRQNRFKTMAEVPAHTEESAAMSKALKRAGFKFCGPTICYAFMQAVGMVNDHLVSCFRYQELAR